LGITRLLAQKAIAVRLNDVDHAEIRYDHFAELGVDARLEKGHGYFYFSGGEATDWLDRPVKLPTLNNVMRDQWRMNRG